MLRSKRGSSPAIGNSLNAMIGGEGIAEINCFGASSTAKGGLLGVTKSEILIGICFLRARHYWALRG
jgi:hypothetical protein